MTLARPILLFGVLVSVSPADVRLPHVFSDGVVLQSGRPVPVWGWGEEGREVKVTFAGQEKTTTVDKHGAWLVTLDPLPVRREPDVLIVKEKDGDEDRVHDVLVGEVWLASGQSNMEWPVKRARGEDQAVARSGPVPGLRVLTMPRKLSTFPLGDVPANWQHATPETAGEMSAVAYFFGRRLAEKLEVPVGVIVAAWGGSKIEPWTPEEGFEMVEELDDYQHYRELRRPGSEAYLKARRRHLEATRRWADAAEEALDRGEPLPAQPPLPPTLTIAHNGELGLYRGMIHPLKPYALRGFVWYQGESNVGDGFSYRWKMEALIRGWRDKFENPDAPFLFAQLAPFAYEGGRADNLPKFWATQTDVLNLPHTGMAVLNDLGDPKDIHPRNKSEVGQRLARLALVKAYDREMVATGPLFRSFKVDGGEVRVTFRHTGDGLQTRDGKAPDSFEIAGTDGHFQPALAKIDGSAVVLTSSAVPEPHFVRFAWADTASPNLVNSADLPASAFHSHWPDHPELGRNVAIGKPYTSSDPNRQGWNAGLTDGDWRPEQGRTFATGDSPQFPKHVTLDLKSTKTIHAVRLGAPAFGSTKSVAVAVSANGQAFEEVGRYEFAARQEDRTTLTFGPREARHVRVTFLEHHPQHGRFPATQAFLREMEVFVAPPEK